MRNVAALPTIASMKKTEEGWCINRGAACSGAELALFLSLGLPTQAGPTASHNSKSREAGDAVKESSKIHLKRASCRHKYLKTSCTLQGAEVHTSHFCCYCNVVLSFPHENISKTPSPCVSCHADDYILKEFSYEPSTQCQNFVFIPPSRSGILPQSEESLLHVHFSKTDFSRLVAVLLKDTRAQAVLKVKCISYAITLLNNILKDDHVKFRRVSDENPALQQAFSIASNQSRGSGIGWRILKHVGFTETRDQSGAYQFILQGAK